MSRIIDLSVALDGDVKCDPPEMVTEITYYTHGPMAKMLEEIFPGLRAADLPDGEGWASERVQCTTHSGTHMDAPWHFASTMNRGERARTIDQLPLEWCFAAGVKLDFRHLPDGYVAQPKDIDAELARTGARIEPRTIVVVNTAAGARYGYPDYMSRGCGMGRAATLHLLEMGVKIVGTDGWSWDAPFEHTRARFTKERDPSIIWEGHKAGREMEYYQMEKLANLEALDSHGYLIACFPVKIARASAGWTRAVAILPEEPPL
ncbi:MAG: cyclase family protein [Steroidobacteraceae bacterium]